MNQGQEAAVTACAYQLWEESGWVTDIIKNIGAKLNVKYSGDTYTSEKADSFTGIV